MPHPVAQDHELDGGASGAAGQERFCALTREAKPAEAMIRFVLGPDGAVVPDLKRKLPGRGLWITATRDALSQAVKRNVFARGFKRELRVSPDLVDVTEQLLRQSALNALAIAGKAGQVIAGFAKVEAALARDGVVALIHAADAAADGRRKLDAALRREGGQKPREIPVIDAFTSEQLGLALNRINVVHAALLAGPVSDSFVARTHRFLRFQRELSSEAAST